MKINCPVCSTFIPASQLNVETDVAVCTRCDEAFSLSLLVATGGGTEYFDEFDSPPGTWFEETSSDWTLGSTTRSSMAFFIVPFMCVWSGFSLGGIYGNQIADGELDLEMSLFGIPFVLGTLLFGSIAVMTVLGKVVVNVRNDSGTVFTGVGPIGWTRRFNWSSMTRVDEENWGTGNSNNGKVISLSGESRLRFGSLLTEPRRYYFLQCLRKLIASRPR